MTTITPLRHTAADDVLVHSLNAAYEDVPSEAELRALEASVLAAIQGGGGGGGAPPVAPKSTPWTTVLTSMLGTGAVAGLVALGVNTLGTDEPVPSVTASVVEVPSAPMPPEENEPSTIAVEAPLPVENAPVRARRPRVEAPVIEAPEETPMEAPTPALVVESEDEMLLLRRATSSLASRPQESLQIAERMEHVAHPEWAEERERVAIEALVRLDRRTEAEARFTRFVSTYPSSAYLPRLRVVLSGSQ